MSGTGEESPRGEWTVQAPEGYYNAIQATGTMVAPILTGFAFAILVLVLVPPGQTEADPLRWRDPVLALLVAAALLLIISTQAAIRARAYLVKPDELAAWYPTSVDEAGRPNQWLAGQQKARDKRTERASAACRHTYNAGAVLLFTAVAVLLVPPDPVDAARRAVLVAATTAVAVETVWLTGTSLRSARVMERLPTLLTPAAYAAAAFVILIHSPSGASRAAAAASIAIAGASAGAAGVRVTASRARGMLRWVGVLVLMTTASSAAAAGLLLADRRHAALLTEITAAALVAILSAAVLRGEIVSQPTA